jgi:nicotinate-nucleotide adenylyltransferase
MGSYPVTLSPELDEKLAVVRAQSKPSNAYRVVIFPGSFDPVHPEHLALGYRAAKIYEANELIWLPAGDRPVHRPPYILTAVQRANSLETEIEKLQKKGLNTSVSRVETDGLTRYTVDSIREIQKRLPVDAEIYILVGEDVFAGLPTWEKALPDLFVNYNWIVAARGGLGSLPNFEETIPGAQDYERITPSMLRNRRTNKTVERENFQTGVYRSATEVRARIKNIQAIFHGVDIQDTFFEFPADDPRVRQRGALGVPGSAQIIDNITALQTAAFKNQRIKNILTKDFHYEIEMKDPKFNGEFHPNPATGFQGFPAHGMALRSGPQGHEIIAEIRDIYPPESRLTIPHHQQTYGSADSNGEDDSLALIPYDLSAHMHQVLDPQYQIVIQKNGPNSYDFAMNPRSKPILDAIGKKPVYIYGVATDFCVISAVKTYLSWGYEVFVVEDAIAGVFEEGTQKALQEMRNAGAKFVTTKSVLEKFRVDEAQTCADALAAND